MEGENRIEQCMHWIESALGCEVYFLHHENKINGFVEYQNGGHVIYVIGDPLQIDFEVFLDILTHEAGHVVYNQRQLEKGMKYEQIVHRTQAKLFAFDQLLKEGHITDEEYDRLYHAIEEEWESNKEKETIKERLIRQLGLIEK